MNRYFSAAALLLLASSVSAQTFREWKDPEVNAVNRAPMRAASFAYAKGEAALAGLDRKNSANYLSLNGTWKFNWVNDASQRPTDFSNRASTTRAGTTFRFPECGNSTATATLCM